jgi:anaerobic selenocysteine-containing dehydrogenase
MNFGDLVMSLTQELGGSLKESLPWSSYEDYLKFRIGRIWDLRRGRVGSRPLTQIGSFEEFWSALFKYGFWSDPPYKSFHNWSHQYRTPTGRFEFYSNLMRERLEEALSKTGEEQSGTNLESDRASKLMEKLLGVKAEADDLFLIHYEPPKYSSDSTEYTQTLVSYKTACHAEGRGANMPFLQELHGWVYHRLSWRTWLEINKDDAEKHGIMDGDMVEVESVSGKEHVVAKVGELVMPGVVAMPYEQGHIGEGRWADGRGANPNRLLEYSRDPLTASPSFSSTKVRISPVRG